jgi:SAM-dependent methyltransferase
VRVAPRTADVEVTNTCRSCGGALVNVLSLGATPLANELLPAGAPRLADTRIPLDLVRCADCSLVQLAQSVSPKRLFAEYVYFSSYSTTALQHAERFVAQLLNTERLSARSLVVEIASNDGYLLQFLRARDIPVLGVEPAANIARFAQDEKGVPTLARFFTSDLAGQLVADGYVADVVIGNNVLAHIHAVNDFVAGVRRLLRSTGTATFEVPYVKDMLDHVEFDTIYHEHQCYYSLTSLVHLFARHGLEVWNIEHLPTHGGSIRAWVAPSGMRAPELAVRELLAAEAAWGVTEAGVYAQFASAVADLKSRLRTTLDDIKSRGARIAAYGAAAKGVTLTSYCGIGRHYLDFVADASPHKQGKLFPVDRLPIEAPSAIAERQPDFVLLLAWNLADEIMRDQSSYTERGGRFIIPVPAPRLLPV